MVSSPKDILHNPRAIGDSAAHVRHRREENRTQLSSLCIPCRVVIAPGAEVIAHVADVTASDAEVIAPDADVIASDAEVTGSVVMLVWALMQSLRPPIRWEPVAKRRSLLHSANEGGGSTELVCSSAEISGSTLPQCRTLSRSHRNSSARGRHQD